LGSLDSRTPPRSWPGAKVLNRQREQSSVARLSITLVKSGIGYNEDQKRTLKALGLRRLNQSVVQDDSAAIRGMINKVRHLVTVEAQSEAK
jgi:large subunit ribosomal protein L30